MTVCKPCRTGWGLLALALFLRHSVQAFGVTTPKPRLRFDRAAAAAVPAGLDVEGVRVGGTEACGCLPPGVDADADAAGGKADTGGLSLVPSESSSIGSIARGGGLDAQRPGNSISPIQGKGYNMLALGGNPAG